MTHRPPLNWALAEPQNATELAFLAGDAWTGARTLYERAHHLADMHALGITLPDDTESPEARAAWENRHHMASHTPPPPSTRPLPRLPLAWGLPCNAAEYDFLVNPEAPDAPRLLVDRLEALAAAHHMGHMLADKATPRARANWEFFQMTGAAQIVN